METDEARSWRGRRVLVTGHTGFKGAWLTQWLDMLGAVVTGYALPPAEGSLFARLRLAGRIDHRQGDVRDAATLARVVADAKPQTIIHLAGQALVSQCYDDPRRGFETNAMGVLNLLEAARAATDLRAIVIVTSDKCYRASAGRLSEEDPLGAFDPYGASKACAEILVESYRRAYFDPARGVGLASARAGNVLGGGDRARDRIMPHVIARIEAGRTPELRHPDGVRPWQHALDAIAGYLRLARALSDAPTQFSEAWNFGPDRAGIWRARDIAEAAMRAWGGDAAWRRAKVEAGLENDVLLLDCAKARDRLGWRPILPIEETVRWTVEGYKRLAEGDGAWMGRQIEAFAERARASSLEPTKAAGAEARHALRAG